MHEIIARVSQVKHGFKPIEHEAKQIVAGHTGHDAFTIAQQCVCSEVYQVRALAVFVFGYLASTDAQALHLLHTTVSHDPSWQVQEILAKAFDWYCHDTGYEQALPVITAWLQSEHPNVCRAVTEGLRIWTSRPYFNMHPDLAVRLISQHHAHESVYLRKSVGNALRDIAKTHPALVEDEMARWDLADKRIQLTYKLVVKRAR